jgi:hypothetical protein
VTSTEAPLKSTRLVLGSSKVAENLPLARSRMVGVSRLVMLVVRCSAGWGSCPGIVVVHRELSPTTTRFFMVPREVDSKLTAVAWSSVNPPYLPTADGAAKAVSHRLTSKVVVRVVAAKRDLIRGCIVEFS